MTLSSDGSSPRWRREPVQSSHRAPRRSEAPAAPPRSRGVGPGRPFGRGCYATTGHCYRQLLTPAALRRCSAAGSLIDRRSAHGPRALSVLITGSTIAPRSPPNHGGGLQGRCGRHRRAGEIAAVSSRARCARACRPRPSLPRNLTPLTWTTYAEPVDRPDGIALLRDYFAELTVRYFRREMTKQEIDETSPGSRAPAPRSSSSCAPTAYPPAASAYTRRASSPASSRPAVSTSRRRPRPAHRRRVMGPPPQPHPPLPRHPHRPGRGPP